MIAVSMLSPRGIRRAAFIVFFIGFSLGVAAPVLLGGRAIGTLYAEINQTLALQSLTRPFSVVGMVAVGLAVLGVIAVLAARGRGLKGGREALNTSAMKQDPLTGLPARQGFAVALADAVQRAAQADAQIGLMIVDIDHFRTVNDVWGHSAGDDVLKTAAERLRAFVENPAGLARISGSCGWCTASVGR